MYTFHEDAFNFMFAKELVIAPSYEEAKTCLIGKIESMTSKLDMNLDEYEFFIKLERVRKPFSYELEFLDEEDVTLSKNTPHDFAFAFSIKARNVAK